MSPVAAGTCKYDIHPKYVLRLDRVRRRLNRQVGVRVDHHVYIWIQRPGRLKKGRPEKERLYHVLYCYIPTIRAFKDKVILERKSVQKESIAKQLKDGYSVISQKILFDWRKDNYEAFYRLVGLL